MIKEISYSLSLFIFVLSTNVFADGVNSQAAYLEAFFETIIKFGIAGVIFYLFTYGLIGKTKNTPLKLARWFGAISGALVIASSTNRFSSQSDYIYSVFLAAIGWYAIGFVFGYLGFKFKQIKASNVDNINAKTYTNKKVLLPILAITVIGLALLLIGYKGIGNPAIYDMYSSCKDDSKDCTKSELSVTFKVDKEKSQVIRTITIAENKRRDIQKLDNCVVLDEHNWQCKDNPVKFDANSIDIPYTYTMSDDEMTMSDGYLMQTLNGKTTTTTYFGYKFVKR